MVLTSRKLARSIIESVGSSGTPPQYGLQHFTAGLDQYLKSIEREYLADYVKDGGSAFKMVVGAYGGGKTHFLYCVRDLAWEHQFAVSFVSLSQLESPFHKLELVYKAIVHGLISPLSALEEEPQFRQGIANFLKTWYGSVYQEAQQRGLEYEDFRTELLEQIEGAWEGIESLSFTSAVKGAVRALLDDDQPTFDHICQWVSAEGYDRRVHAKLGILERIDKSTAASMIRSLAQWLRRIGFSGLVILLDEAERVPSLSSKQRELHLSNLRELIDACGTASFQGVMAFYAVPDDNFLDGRTQVYEALKQRLSTLYDLPNPSGVRIELERLIPDAPAFLSEVGTKLAAVYEQAYGHEFEPGDLQETIGIVSESALEERYGEIGYKRLFVQRLVRALHLLRADGKVPDPEQLTT